MSKRHHEEWDLYYGNADGEIACFVLDLGWSREGPDKRYPKRVIVRVACRDQSRSGLPNTKELDRVRNLLNKVINALCRKRGVVHVGDVQTGSSREAVFFVSPKVQIDESLFKNVPKAQRAEPFLSIERDPKWLYYFDFMFPPPVLHRRMLDTRVLNGLAESGDDHGVPRRVDHWIYFGAGGDRTKFVRWSKKNGYVVERLIEPEKARDLPGVQIFHTSGVTPDQIHPAIASLVQAATRAGGAYDGWETFVMRPGKR